MATKMIAILDPTAKAKVQALLLAPRLGELNNKRIGFFWNYKPNGNLVLMRLKELLSQRFPLADTVWREKPNATVGGAPPLLNELAGLADAVVNGVAD